MFIVSGRLKFHFRTSRIICAGRMGGGHWGRTTGIFVRLHKDEAEARSKLTAGGGISVTQHFVSRKSADFRKRTRPAARSNSIRRRSTEWDSEVRDAIFYVSDNEIV